MGSHRPDFLARASRSAVRFFAAAREAFLARADLSSGVIFFADALPPSAPNLREISVIAARMSAGIFTLIRLDGTPDRVSW